MLKQAITMSIFDLFRGGKGGGVETISPVDALNKLKEGVKLIDVREPAELKSDGKVSKAVNIPLGQLSPDKLPQDKEAPLMFMCRSGARSSMAARQASSWGYTTVYNVQGGIMGWKATGTSLK